VLIVAPPENWAVAIGKRIPVWRCSPFLSLGVFDLPFPQRLLDLRHFRQEPVPATHG
jgi:hypothetical protein